MAKRRRNLRHRAERDYTKVSSPGKSDLYLPTAWLKKGGGKKKNPSVTLPLKSLKRLLTGARTKRRTVVKARVR